MKKIPLILLNILSFLRNKNNLRILVYHHVENFKRLYNQLKDLKKDWNFITPKQFEDHLNKIYFERPKFISYI